MSNKAGLHNCKDHISSKIRSRLIWLTTRSKYDRIAQKIEYWIEYVLRERFMTVDELVEGVSYVAWEDGGSFANVGRFLKEFRDAPHRSEQARSFVNQLCSHILRWFAIASVDYLPKADDSQDSGKISRRAGSGFIRAASFVGHLIASGLLSHELVRQHLLKPLTDHYYGDNEGFQLQFYTVRANAIYQLFIAAGNTILQGLFEAEDVWVCFETLDAQSKEGNIKEYDAARVKELRKAHDDWLEQKGAEEQRNATKADERQKEEEEVTNSEVPVQVETPVAFAPQDLPIDVTIPSSILQDIESPSALHGVESLSEAFINVPAGAASSPTLSISSVSDLTPTEFGEEIERGEEQAIARHDTFYFEDGNVEVVCGLTLFRVHSTIISFSSSKLRDVLSPSALLHAPTPEGRPRITISESAEDFGILLKMIYTPEFPARHEVPEFTIFASLLRMTTKYSFTEVRNQLLKDLRGAYPTKWEDFRGAKVLGEDIFGSPKPHPNAVLNLFETQNVRFAIPFAAYRVSIGGFSSLMSDKPGTVLPRRTLATAIQGMHVLRSMGSHLARVVAHGGDLERCPDQLPRCALTIETRCIKERKEALEKIYNSLADEREGGVLTPPLLEHFVCAKCARVIVAAHTSWGSICWKKLPPVFAISNSWDDL